MSEQNRPAMYLQIAIGEARPVWVHAPVTDWIPSNDWNSGDYEVTVLDGDLLLRYSTVGGLSAVWGNHRAVSDLRLANPSEHWPLTVDFGDWGGPSVSVIDVSPFPPSGDGGQEDDSDPSDGPVPFSPLLAQVITQMSRDTAYTTNTLLDGYRRDAATHAATLAAIRDRIETMLSGEHMPNPLAILRALYPHESVVDRYRQDGACDE